VSRGRPTLYRWGEYDDGEFLLDLCPDDLARYTGLRLKPGECKQVRFSVEVLDD